MGIALVGAMSPMIQFLIYLFLSLGLPSLAIAGANHGGGGSGVACFQNSADAKNAWEAWRKIRPFPRDLIPKITKLQVTDYWERPGHGYEMPRPSEGVSTYTERIIGSFLAGSIPTFSRKIRGALLQVDQAMLLAQSKDHDEQNGKNPSPVYDTEEILGMNRQQDRCAPVQIIIRWPIWSQDGKLNAKMHVDWQLYNLLGLDNGHLIQEQHVFHQSMLRVHEALYLMGYGLGHETSKRVRILNASIFSRDLFIKYVMSTSGSHAPYNAPTASLTLMHNLFELGFGTFPFFETSPRMTVKKMQLYKAYLQVEGDAIQTLGRRRQVKSILNQNFNSYNESESFIVTAQLALLTGRLKDFYALIDPEQWGQSEETQVCAYNNWFLDQVKNLSPSVDGQVMIGIARKAERWCLKNL